MSGKINILGIVKGHIATLSDPAGKVSFADLVTFFLVPGLSALLALLAKYNLNKDILSMLVNFGAIFTALLLSVLVLVYDQENKLRCSERDDYLCNEKIELLRQLYFNICYSIVSSLVLIFLCLAHSVFDGVVSVFDLKEQSFSLSYSAFFVTPLIIFVVVNLVLTILMIVKRIHVMLTLR